MERLRSAFTPCIALAFALVLAGCAGIRPAGPELVPAAPAPPPAPAPVSVPMPVEMPPPAATKAPQAESRDFNPLLYKLWYATNRVPVVSKGEIVDYAPKWDQRAIHYGNIYVEIPEDYIKKVNSSSWLDKYFPTWEAKLRVTKPNEVDAQVFVAQLKNALKDADPKERQVLIYLHGFNTTFTEAAQRAASLGYQLKMPNTAFFSWPSQGKVPSYEKDRDLAELSQDSIADFIIKAWRELGATRIHLIAHSMGNYALLGAMYRPIMQQAIKDGLRFGQVILAAPDVESQRFKKDAGVFGGIADRVTLYVSDGDKALKASKRIAAKMDRAGLRPPFVVVKSIDTVDVSSTNLTLLGHAYVSQEVAVLNDMYSLILHNDPPAKRMNVVRKDEYWELH